MSTSDESANLHEQVQTQFSPAPSEVEPLAPQIKFHPNNPPWGLTQALLTWVLSVVILFLAPLIIGLPYIIYRYQGELPTRELLLKDKMLLFISVLSYIPIHALTFMLVWAVVTQFRKFPFWDTIGWSWSRNVGPWKSAGLAVVLFALGTLLVYLIGGQETDVERIIQSSRPTAYLLAFIAVATAPIVEETVYRGVLYPALQRSIGPAGAVLLVAGLFAAGHFYQYRENMGVFSAIVLLSVSLTLVRAWTGRLLPCFVIHLIFNGIQSAEIVLAPHIRALDTGGEQKAASMLLFLQTIHQFF